MGKVRLDVLLVEKGLTESRERARTTIMSGIVFVDGQRVDKPGTSVSQDASVEVRGKTLEFVSRGGLKLEKALPHFGVSAEGKTCMDVGASTGGFTDVLLQGGARRVYAIDVGYGQLAWRIRNNPRVIVMERTNIRAVTKEMIPDEPALAVIDVSFISLSLVLPVVRGLLAPDGEVICLVKPQFEAGREKVGKKGVVRDRDTHLEVLEAFSRHVEGAGFVLAGLTFSPIRGPEGNIEYLGYLKSSGERAEIDFKTVVTQSHTAFTIG